MKKLGNGKGKVHPAPAPRGHLAALPAAVMTLAATLTAGEQEVLAYMLSGGGRWREQWRRRAHPPELGCDCFGCYKSFWARWDASPNRHVIHRIIDAVEESLESRERGRGRRRKQRERKGCDLAAAAAAAGEEILSSEAKRFLEVDGGHLSGDNIVGEFGDEGCVDDSEEEEEAEDEVEQENDENNSHESKSSVRRFMSFLGESVWGVWS